MEKEQQEEVRQLILDVIGKPLEEIIGRLNVVNANLVRIEGNTQRTEEQQKIANGRTGKLEGAVEQLKQVNLVHTINCPNTKILKEMELASKDRKENCPYKAEIETLKTERISRASVVKFVVGVVAASGAFIALLEYLKISL